MDLRSSGCSDGRVGVASEKSNAIHPLASIKEPKFDRQSTSRSRENNADDEDESEWTLRALSTLDKKERVFGEDKSPRAPFAAPVSQTPMLAAVRDLIRIVETEVLDSNQKGKSTDFEGRKRLVLAVEWAKHEITAEESRRHEDWTRVLALSEDIDNQPKNVSELAKDLQQLAQIRVGGDFSTMAAALVKNKEPERIRLSVKPLLEPENLPQINDTDSIDGDCNSSSSSGDSNQHEEDDREVTETDHENTIADDWSENGSTEAQPLAGIELTTLKTTAKRPLSLTVAEPIKKEVQEPKPPKSSTTNCNLSSAYGKPTAKSTSGKPSRLKFQFPEADLTQLHDDDSFECSTSATAIASNTSSSARRRVSASITPGAPFAPSVLGITGAVPLRRKSFSMKRSPHKSLGHLLGNGTRNLFAVAPSAASPKLGTSRAQAISSMRRKSTTAFDIKAAAPSTSPGHSSRRKSIARLSHLALSPGRPQKPSARRASMLAASPSKAMAIAASSNIIAAASSAASCSQLVLRVRERKSDGVRELVMRKRSPGMTIVWQWQDRRHGGQSLLDEYDRFIKLGPHQHGVMLKQLRYVKSAMHDLPWAKTHLRNLLARYTSQELSKEELYPQLALLSTQVQGEVSTRAARSKQIASRKLKLTVQLTLATGVVNDVRATKYGRRGRPHATRLCYDPSDPLRLRWIRKSGERSDEFLPVDELEVLEQGRAVAREGSNFSQKRLVSSGSESESDDCGCLLSIVTASGSRALDLRVKSPLHREWLATALREIASFAQQFRAASAESASPAASRRLRIQHDI